MSSKPASVAQWCTAGLVITAPTTGKAAAGWQTDEELPAQYLNWLQNIAGLWQQYLSDGSFTGGVTIDTLTVTGDFKVDGDYQPDGSTAQFLGDISCGNMEIQGDYKLTGGSMFSQDLDLLSSRVTGCAAYEYAAGFSPSQGIIASALSWFWSSHSITNQLRSGDHIREFTIHFSVCTSTSITISLVKYDTGSATATTVQSWTDTTTGIHTYSANVTAGGGYTINTLEKAYLVITNNSTGSSNDTITRIYIGYDHP